MVKEPLNPVPYGINSSFRLSIDYVYANIKILKSMIMILVLILIF